MGHPCGYFLGTASQRFVVSIMNFKLTVFLEGNLSFIEAPWQPFNRTNRSPQSRFLIVEMVCLSIYTSLNLSKDTTWSAVSCN